LRAACIATLAAISSSVFSHSTGGSLSATQSVAGPDS
jgi:hypothetical protein